METIINYFAEGGNVIAILSVLLVISATVVCIDKCISWVLGKLRSFYNHKKGKESIDEQVTNNKNDLKEITSQLNTLIKQFSKFSEENIAANINILRVVIISGCHYAFRDKVVDSATKKSLLDAYDIYNGVYKQDSYVTGEIEKLKELPLKEV